MRVYFGLGQLSATEKSDILNQHRSLYNGYQTMQPQVSNTQPLTVYDFAGDKEGLVVNNKGQVKRYTNMGINEQVEESKEVCDECGAMEMSEAECSECGGMMYEGECSECGYRGGEMDEETGHLDDIYKVRDLNLKKGDFDYVEGGGNDYGTFEGMHKGLYKESSYVIGSDGKPRDMKPGEKFSAFSPEDFEDDYDFEDEDDFENPDNEDDAIVGSDDLEIDSSEMYEQGYTGGGNAPDMDLSNIEPAYDFVSDGPMAGGDVYPTESEMDEEYEEMESAWSEDIDEIDVSGAQGVYGDMDPAYDFDSEGPGKAGPYQTFSNEGETDEQYLPKHAWKHMARQQAAKDKGEDFDPNEFDPSDYEDLDPMSSWEDIKNYFGDSDWSEIDEDLQESFHSQKNKIMEMMNRMKVM